MQSQNSLSYVSAASLALTHSCRRNCAYCSFHKEDSPLLPITELKEKLTFFSNNNITAVTFLSGDSPQDFPHIQIQLHELGFASYVDYLIAACSEALAHNLIPILSIGYPDFYTASRLSDSGCMFNIDLICSPLNKNEQPHTNTMGRTPAIGKNSLISLHSNHIPYSVGFRIGIGESPQERIDFIQEISRTFTADPYLQDIRIVPFQPSPACELYDKPPLPFESVKEVVELIKDKFPVHHISIPPHLFFRYPKLLPYGLNDLGTLPMLSGDPLNPSFSVPGFAQLKTRLTRHNIHLYERHALVTPAASNREKVLQVTCNNLEKIKFRNSSGLNLCDDRQCFVCGQDNESGMKIQIKKYIKDNTCDLTFTPGPAYQGYAGILHGGIISTLLDEAMAHAIIGHSNITPVTADMHVRFIKPAPIGLPLRIIATKTGERKNIFFARASAISSDGTTIAEAEARFAKV